MAKFEATVGRLFRRIFICKKCKTKIRTDTARIIAGAIKCRRCECKAFRPIKSKSKG